MQDGAESGKRGAKKWVSRQHVPYRAAWGVEVSWSDQSTHKEGFVPSIILVS